MLAFVRAHWRRAVAVGALCAVAMAGWVATRPRVYRSAATFVVEGRRSSSAVSAIAAQFGVSIGAAGDAMSSAAFYADVALSRDVLADAVSLPLPPSSRASTDSADATLAFKLIGVASPEDRLLQSAAGMLRGRLVVAQSPKTSIITVSANAPDPALARLCVTQLLTAVDRFAARVRRERLESERRFGTEAAADASRKLESAEEELASFLRANRLYQSSPDLIVVHDRLQRKVTASQSMYVSLAQMAEQSRIEQDRDLATITIVESPLLPLHPVPGKFATLVPAAFLLGVFLSMLLHAGMRTDAIAMLRRV